MGMDFKIKSEDLNINNPNLKILKVDRSSIFNYKVENGDDINTSIFKDEYRKAANSIIDIINTQKILKEVDNIVSFIGGKGSGKTTFLKGFINLLNEESFKKADFEILNIIDLNYMEEENNIISIILYNIYKSFCMKGNVINSSWKKEIEDIFNKVFKYIESEREGEGTFLQVNNTFLLKEGINELIRTYLNCCKKEYLIIPIDNIGCFKNVKNIVQDVKKYFNYEKVIILFTIDNNLIDERKIAIDDIGIYSNAIYIKPIDIMSIKLQVNRDEINNIPEFKGNNIYEQIKDILFKKFKYCLSSVESFNVIVSNNLKRIINLIIFINSIKDASSEQYTILKYLETILQITPLGGKQNAIIKAVLNLDISEINKFILVSLSELIVGKKNKGEIKEEIEGLYTYITNNRFKIKKEKVAIGDVITAIEIFKSLTLKNSDKAFIELLKCSYTTRLLFEYNNQAKGIFNIIGRDYIGDYFKLLYNIDQFNNLIEVGGKKSAEDLKFFFGFRKELFLSILEPCYDYNNTFSRFVNDDRNVFNEEDIYKQRYYIFKFLNIISHSLFNDSEEKQSFLLYIINIDYWINILNILAVRLKSNNIPYDRYFCETIEYFKGIIDENRFLITDEEGIDDYDEINVKGIEGDFIVKEDEVEFLQNLDNELIKAQYLYSYNV